MLAEVGEGGIIDVRNTVNEPYHRRDHKSKFITIRCDD